MSVLDTPKQNILTKIIKQWKNLKRIADKLNDVCGELLEVKNLSDGQEGVLQGYVDVLTAISEGLKGFVK